MELRLATMADLPRLRPVMDAAIAELQKGFLSEQQIDSSRQIMGLDTQLVEDGTYFVVEHDGEVAGCGGWSRRATLYGSDDTARRDAHPPRPPPRTLPGCVRCTPTRASPGVGSAG
jgi:hypothetical protein